MKQTIAILVCAGAALAQNAPERKRVFVAPSDSWQVKGARGGAAPQTAEIIKTFGERCPSLIVTANKDRADYVVTLDHEGGKGWALKDTKVAVFNKDGDVIYSGSTRSLGGGVKDACTAVLKAEGK